MPVAQTRLEKLQICKLLQCVRNEDKSQIEKLCESGVPHLINYNEPNDGETALTIAAEASNEGMIEFLLQQGAHPDVVDLKGRSAIMRAAEYGHVLCVEALAKAGADMTLTDLEGRGVIFFCISDSERHRMCLDIVLKYNADVNNVGKDGIPVFTYACETSNENEEMCLALLEKGADVSIKAEKTSRTCLMAACKSGSSNVCRKILENNKDIVNQVMTYRPKWHAGHEAAAGGFLECLKVLAAYGANFDQYDDAGNNPIHIAATNGHGMCCKFLAQRGCNPKPKNNEGNQPKAIAKDNGHKEAAKECRKGEKIFGKIGKNNEPWALALYDFIYEHQNDVVDGLQKFDENSTGRVTREDLNEVLTSLNAPIPKDDGLLKIVKLHDPKGIEIAINDFVAAKKWINKQYLMSAFEGKKKKKKGKGGKKKAGKFKNPMEVCVLPEGPRAANGGPPAPAIAQHLHYTDIGRFNRDHPPVNPMEDDSAWYVQKPQTTYINMNDAAKHGDIHSLKDALNRGQHVDTKDKFYKTPLMVAALNGNIEVAKFLIDQGADIHTVDNFFWSPLHFACHSGVLDLVQYLVEKGAELEAQTMNQATPLIRAIESGRPEVVKYLIEAGSKCRVELQSQDPKKDGLNLVEQAMYTWADPRVKEIVQEKLDSLPPPADKKKQKGKDKKDKKGKKAGSPDGDRPAGLTMTQEEQLEASLPHRHKGSILRAASALAGGIDEQEDITFVPVKVWTTQDTTKELIHQREVRRDRFGWEVDFNDFQMPFHRNISRMVEEEGGFDP